MLVCLSGAGYYYLNKPHIVSAGSKTNIQADLKRGKAIEAELEREKADNIRKREELVKSFGEILNGPPERLVVEAILKGDSNSAAKMAKIWEMIEPTNETANWLAAAFEMTRACGNERCAGDDYNEGFYDWLKNLKVQYPDNPHVKMMTAGIADDFNAVTNDFNEAIKMKNSNLDFNFRVGLCSHWIGNEVTDRLRKDWNSQRSVPTALRLAQRLTCCNDDFCATAKEGQEAQRVLEAALKIASVNDLESIRDAYVWAKARQSKNK